MRFPATLLAATLLCGAPAMSTESNRPVRLEIIHEADFLDITVLGDADAAADATFKLEVASQGQGGRSTTVQGGANRRGGPGGTLLRSRISTSGLKTWTATLRVQSAGREYVVARKG